MGMMIRLKESPRRIQKKEETKMNAKSGTAARLVLGAAMAGNLLDLPLASQAATYSFTDLNPTGFTGSASYGISGSQQVGFGYAEFGGYHALLWSGTTSSVVDLNPSGFTYSIGQGIWGSQQVGVGGVRSTGNAHALLWSGTASSVADLNPSGFYGSTALGISDSQQVGFGWGPAAGYAEHALLWSGTASSVVDLNPSGFTSSWGYGICGGQQVGFGSGSTSGNNYHALLWSGTASSVVDLNPIGFAGSIARGISGSQQVGIGHGFTTGHQHALLWSGWAGSVVDLNPSGFTYSEALGTSGNHQHALLWSGTASSVVDLGSLLSSDYGYSVAQGIDSHGNIVGSAYYIPTGQEHAMLWTVLPESIVICNDPGQCGAVATYSTGASVTCSPASGSFFPVGTNTVICTSTNPLGIYTFTITVKDCEPPVVSCRAVSKPSSKESSKADKDSEREEDADGLFQLLGHDNCDSSPRLYIQDSVSGSLAGPFANGDIVKVAKTHGRQDSDDAKDSKNGRNPIVAHIGLEGNGLLYGVDASGNVGASVLCSVRPGRGD